ncbi:MAG: hypothetical protein ACOVP4_10415 [Bacteriovoracaceae bacterium]|jgi:hypothetical protein
MLMTKFNDLLQKKSHSFVSDAQFDLTYKNCRLQIRFDHKEIIREVAYEAPREWVLWMAALADHLQDKKMQSVGLLPLSSWMNFCEGDLAWQEYIQDELGDIDHPVFELWRGIWSQFQGRDHFKLKAQDFLVCRCFGVSLYELQHEKETNAAMGCRSCFSLVQKIKGFKVKRDLKLIKNRSKADWILLIDQRLKSSPEFEKYQFEILSMRDLQLVLKINQKLTQDEEVEVTLKIQDFLRLGVDPDLSVFLAFN